MKLAARLFAAFLCALLPALAWAQTPIVAGPWTQGHVPMFVGAGSFQPVIQDSGPAAGGISGLGLGELMLQARGTGTPPFIGQGTGPLGTNACDYDAPTNNATGYHWFCLSPDTTTSLGQGALIAVGAGGVAAQIPLFISVNGTTYSFPFALSGVLGPGSSTSNDAACWNNASGTLLKDCGTTLRAKLAATTTFFVSNTGGSACGAFTCSAGTDNTSCGTSNTTPCATISFALTQIAAAYDFAGQTVNVQVADGTYNECVNLPVYLTTSNTDKNVFLLGNSGNNTNVTVTCSGFNTFTAVNSPQGWVLKNLNVNATNACLFADYHSSIFWDGGNFSTCTNAQAQAGGPGAFIEFVNHPYTISGSSQYHALAGSVSEILWQATATATIIGSPTFSQALLSNARGGLIDDHFTSFSGAFTGKKYLLSGPTINFFSGTVSAGNTSPQYFGAASISATESNYQTLASPAAEIVDLNVNVTAAPGGTDTYTFTLRQGAGNTNLTCTITGVATSCNDSIHLSGNSYLPGSVYDIKMVSSNAASTALMSASVVVR